MTKVVNIKLDGTLTVFIDDVTAIASVNHPLLPNSVVSEVAACFSEMTAEGILELHMEETAFRSFTHILKPGSMEAIEGITNPVFAVLISAKDELNAVYGPPAREDESDI